MPSTIEIRGPQWLWVAFVWVAIVGSGLILTRYTRRGERRPRATVWTEVFAFVLINMLGLWLVVAMSWQEGALRVTFGPEAVAFDYRFSEATVSYRDVTHLAYRVRKGSRGTRIHEVTVTTPTGTQSAWAKSSFPEEVAAVREVFDQLSTRVPQDRITMKLEP